MENERTETGCSECPRCAELQMEIMELRAKLNSTQTAQSTGPKSRWTATDDRPFLQEYYDYRKREFLRSKDSCRIKVVPGDLVGADEEYKVHLVSADMKRSRGVAAPFAEAYGPVDPTLKFKIGDIHEQTKNGTTLLNVVHKEKYYHKFGYDPNAFLANIVDCLAHLKDFCVERGIRRLALVRIASQTEKVHWRWTQMKILEIFADIDITLVVYLQRRPKRVFHKTNSTPEEAETMPTDKTDDGFMENVAERLAALVDKGKVGGGSLSMLPSPNRKPPRHPLPDKVNAVGKGERKSNSSFDLRNDAKDGKKDAMKGAKPKQRMEVAKKSTRNEALPRHLSGGGGNTTPSPPSSVPPLTNIPKKVNSGGSSRPSVPNGTSSSSVAVDNDLTDVILMLRDDMVKIKSQFDELRRSMTPKGPVSPASSAYVNSKRGGSFQQKNNRSLVSPLTQ
jgi:hypothetical protein